MSANNLYEALCRMPMMDAHTHLDADHFTARNLDDVMLYHMVISDLYSAGCPDGGRIAETRTEEEAHRRIGRAVPYLPYIANTSCCWGLRTILKDLYGYEEEITEVNWRYLDSMIAERAGDDQWGKEVLRKAGIHRVSTEYARKGDGRLDDIFVYSLEWAFFTRTQWGRFDASLLELEHAWNQVTPGPPLPVTASDDELRFEKKIRTIADVEAAMAYYISMIPEDEVATNASHLSTDIEYRAVSREEMEAALANRERAGVKERDVYANYLENEFLKQLRARKSKLILQFSIGAEPLPYETGSILHQETGFQFATIINQYPDIQFMFFLSNRALNQQLCTFAREFPNVSLAAYWWHNFFPDAIRSVMGERLDMVAQNKQIGFFSDAYTVEWIYAKAMIVRRQLARVLNERVEMGQYDEKTALSIARAICYDTPRAMLKMEPAKALL